MLETTRIFETPEGVELHLQIAGPVIRACAWLLDSVIRLGVYIVLSLLASFGELGTGVMLIGIFLMEWFYPVIFEVYRGATPGKKFLGLEVCNDNGTPIDWQSSLIRNLLRVADFLPFFYAFGLISMIANQDFKRLGDIVAGTLVVYRAEEVKALEIPDTVSIAPEMPLQILEQRAVLDFAERHHSMSTERAIELAEILGEELETNGENAVNRLYGYANWMRKGDSR